jgi:hypothetical protein
MNFTATALQQLVAEERVIRARASQPPVGEQACRRLRDTLVKLRQKRTLIKLDRPKLDVQATWSRFAASRHNLNALDGLEFRTLCSAAETALRPEFVAALMQNQEKLMRSRCLYALVNSYFSGWRTMQDPSEIEKLLISVFIGYGGKNPIVQKWLASRALFSENAASFLAEEICEKQRAVDEVLHEYYVGPVTKLGLSVRSSVADAATAYLLRMEPLRDGEWSLRYLQWMTEKVLTDVTAPEAFFGAVGSLILSQSAKRAETFQRALCDYIQNHKRLGDPRLRESAVNWRSVAPEAAKRYLSWLARDSILFFFNTILPNNSDNRRRKDFWLRYRDRIRDFQVAVSETDIWKVKSSQRGSEALYYSTVAHPTTSAFLMKFEGYGGSFLVVEFSEKGNAAYIFRMSDFEGRGLSLRTRRFELRNHLKFDDSHRILHIAEWEPKAAYKLAAEFGIRP